ncbi:MAG: thioredoxin-like domain-containing protein [Bacteroidota bacterium]
MTEVAYAGKVNAPDFPTGLQWLNTDRPISLRELRGKIVLLDFWTYCCINCMHVIPDLKRLEAAYPAELVVIGVHSAKFTTEQGTENIREAILRYGIHHPVVNDKDFEVWNAYAAHAWPTFILIDPDGKVYGRHSGEGVFDAMNPEIARMVKEFDAKGKIDRRPIKFDPERAHAPQSFLSFPGKIASDPSKHRLVVTDSDHHRVLVVSMPDATVRAVIGSGVEGFADGTFETAQFRRPQGVAIEGDTLFIADTENHAIRLVDLSRRTVSTLAGTGAQAKQSNVPGTGSSVALNSPWDIVADHGRLFVAMAGSHQIWTLDVHTLEARPYAGSGREDIIDGPLTDAALAQPSGISRADDTLYIADSEVSAVRSMSTDGKGIVHTIVGEGLFDFGDVDGRGTRVRLQHPIGICCYDGAIYVADTYNNKIKMIDPRSKSSTTVVGTGKSGMDDGDAKDATLNEPNGLCFLDGIMYITDTNNNLIRAWDPRTGKVSTVQMRGIGTIVEAEQKRAKEFAGERIQLAQEHVAEGPGFIDVSVGIPDGYKLNDIAPFYIGCSVTDPHVVEIPSDVASRNVPHPEFPLRVPVTFSAGAATAEIDLIVYYCAEREESLCLIKQLKLIAPVVVSSDASGHVVRCTAEIHDGKAERGQ